MMKDHVSDSIAILVPPWPSDAMPLTAAAGSDYLIIKIIIQSLIGTILAMIILLNRSII